MYTFWRDQKLAPPHTHTQPYPAIHSQELQGLGQQGDAITNISTSIKDTIKSHR